MFLEPSSHYYAMSKHPSIDSPDSMVFLTSLTCFPVLMELGVVIVPKVMGRGDDYKGGRGKCLWPSHHIYLAVSPLIFGALEVGFLVREPDCIPHLSPLHCGLPATAQGTRGHTSQPSLGSQFLTLLTLEFRGSSPMLTLSQTAAPGASSKFYLLLLTALSSHSRSGHIQ